MAQAREPRVKITADDFDTVSLQRELTQVGAAMGAIVSFVGLVRDFNQDSSVESIELEHYPGMTEKCIEDIIDQAASRWQIGPVRVVHRIGILNAGDQIVYVGVTSRHRGEAFHACEFIMDYLKISAPLWKKEWLQEGAVWVDARESDDSAADRWIVD
ncbi:MAG: molybdopterin synthase catalytic subunit [Halieaceae bacterium]|jgi:molybdopterin synthase catalytic subunit